MVLVYVDYSSRAFLVLEVFLIYTKEIIICLKSTFFMAVEQVKEINRFCRTVVSPTTPKYSTRHRQTLFTKKNPFVVLTDISQGKTHLEFSLYALVGRVFFIFI